MSKTSKPLTIWIAPEWYEKPWVVGLTNAGHFVHTMTPSYGVDSDWCHTTPDLILHPSAHMWSEDMVPMLDIAIKAARERKYATKVKD